MLHRHLKKSPNGRWPHSVFRIPYSVCRKEVRSANPQGKALATLFSTYFAHARTHMHT